MFNDRPDSRTLWPSRESMYDLMLLRASIGPAAFASEKQSDPIDPSLSEWPAEWFEHAAFWFEAWPDHLAVRTIGIDPSKGRDAKHGDYSAIIDYGRDLKGWEYVEADLARRPTDAICLDVARIAKRRRQLDGIMLEANAFQDLLAPPLTQALRAEKVETTITLADNTAPKPVRIRRLTQPLCERRMRFKRRSPGTMKLVQQLRDFPNGDHDDGPDALEMARRLAVDLWNAKSRGKGR